MIKSNPNPKRYNDLDFIIPFLINHNTQSTQMDSAVKKKRASVPSRIAEMNHNSSREVMRIYKPMKKGSVEKSQKKIRVERQRQEERQKQKEKEKELHRERMASQLQLSLHRSPYVANNRFYKAQSVSNHIPSTHLPQQPSHLTFAPLSTQKPTERSPIPGIRFKKRSMFHQSANIITPQYIPDELTEYKSQMSNKIKAGREKKEWDKKRCANVDFIINRKCKTFNDLISEYRRRLGIETVNKIFIFNSKDFWLRRVLLDRGWLQNQNKDSRAFHLIWSSRVYKQRMFPEQLSNHYRNSDLLTSKTGLHRMLLKYNLTELQPKTFDLTLQRQQFIMYYVRLSFIGKLKTVISKFQFQDGPIFNDFQEIKQHLLQLRSNQDVKGYQSGVIQEELFNLVESCMFLLQNKVERINMYAVDHVLFIVHPSLVLSHTEEELIRMARDFNELAKKAKLFEKELQNGCENLWLTKSKTSSKGVGISLHKDYDSIVKHQHRLAQKYIENPLIFKDASIKGRKFDIRIWVLLVGSSRAKVYYHDKFYGRLCYEAYSLQTINLDNEKKHLTNYSQNKQKYRQESTADSIILPQTIFGLIMKQKGVDFRDQFYAKVQQMLSKLALIFRGEIAFGSQNSFQLFGLDLLIDQALNLHLLEVNLSAACEQRHEGLTTMLQELGHGMLNILQVQQGQYQLRGWRVIK